MKPTNKLRFVERYVPSPQHGEGINVKVKILQQWWEDSNPLMRGLWKDGHGGEWRDIPLETE